MRTNYTPSFEMFWKLYPDRWDRDERRRIKRKKAPAYEKWKKLPDEIKAECLLIAKRIRSFEGSSVRDCVTWINQKGWEEMRPDENKARPTNEQVKEMADKLAGKWTAKPEKQPEPSYLTRKRLLNEN